MTTSESILADIKSSIANIRAKLATVTVPVSELSESAKVPDTASGLILDLRNVAAQLHELDLSIRL